MLVTKRIKIIAFMAGFSLFCATLEYLFPKPVPFFRLGLANFPLLLVLPFFNIGDFLLLVLLKVLGQGIINGTFLSYVFLFSLSGSFASAFVMLVLKRLKFFSLFSISLFGSLSSNIIQSILAIYFIFGEIALIILVPILIIGCVSGCVIGYLALLFSKKSNFLKQIQIEYEKI